jgi:hypothetical protein
MMALQQYIESVRASFGNVLGLEGLVASGTAITSGPSIDFVCLVEPPRGGPLRRVQQPIGWCEPEGM